MAGDKREVRVAVVGDAGQLQRELLKAEGKINSFGSNAKSAGDTLRTALFGGAVLYGAQKLVKAAGDLQQSIGGTAAVFKEAAGPVDEFAKNAADLVGLSENAARTVTSKLGASLQGFGLSAEEAAKQSVALTKTGADLASTLGGTTQGAVDALGSALRGEYDPLEQFGVVLKASEVNAKAVAMGLAETETSVSNYAKGQATLALITEKSAFAQNNFAKEADTAQGQQQRAAASLENTSAKLGQSLLPIYTKIQEVVVAVAEAFGMLPAPVQTGLIGLTGIAIVGPKIVDAFGSMVSAAKTAGTAILDAGTKAVTTNTAIASMNISTTATTQAATAASIAMGPLVAVMAVAAIGFKVWSDEQQRAARQSALNKERTEAFSEAIKDNTKTFQENIRSVIAQDFATRDAFKFLPTANFEKFAESVTGSREELKELVAVANEANDGGTRLQARLGKLADGGNTLAAEIQRAGREMLLTGQATTIASDDVEALVLNLDSLGRSLDESVNQQNFVSNVVENLGQSFEGQATEIEKATKAIEDNSDAMRAARDPYFKVYESVLEIEQAQKEYNETVAEFGPEAVETAEATKKLAEAGFEYFDALSALAVAQGEGKASAAELERQFQLLVAAGVDPNTEAMVRLKQAILDAGGAAIYVGGLQPKITVTADITEAQQKLRELVGLTRELTGEYGQGLGILVQKRASGGPVDSGTPYLVGEQGPELFMPNTAGRIIDAFSTSKALLNNTGAGMAGPAGGGITINVSVSPTADRAAIGQTIVEAISSYERRSGTGWRS